MTVSPPNSNPPVSPRSPEDLPGSAASPDDPTRSTGSRFSSILFGDEGTPDDLETRQTPGYLRDLNLDQVVESIASARSEYRLASFLEAPLSGSAIIGYRQCIARELEHDELCGSIESFASGMRTVRAQLDKSRDARYLLQSQSWFLRAAGLYCETVERFAGEMETKSLGAAGLIDFRDYLVFGARKSQFTKLAAEQSRIQAELSTIVYTIDINGDRITVDDYERQADFGAEIDQTFERFRQGKVKKYSFNHATSEEMNHIEAEILDQVEKLNPETFTDLNGFCEEYQDFLDPALVQFDREVQFYLAYLEYIARIREAGLQFCYPEVCERSKDERVTDTFDLALAWKLVQEHGTVVTNDFEFDGKERIFVVSGPNQGGKTTFARCFGQLHYLARLGLPVPGSQARLYLSDRIFTHFERQEDNSDLRGKLEDDLLRLRRILDEASSRSVVVVNESFSSTALEDASLLGRRVIERISELDLLGVYVTFVDELASINEKTVSLTSTVDPDDPATRTFKVVRRPADGRAYAIAIAEKYRLAYEQLKGRIES